MRKLIRAGWSLVAVAATLVFATAAMAADQPIDAFEAGQQAAWNAHDAAAYSAAFAPDAAVINADGELWDGQAEAARNLGAAFGFMYARAQLRLFVVQVRMPTPDLALVTLRWSIAGVQAGNAGRPAGEQHGFASQVLQRHGDSWLILSQQDTAASASLPGVSPAPIPLSHTPPAAAVPVAPPPVRRCILARANHDCLIYGKPTKPPTN